MPKVSWNDYSSTPASNTDIDSVNIDEGCAPSGINNAIRELMAHTADVVAGTTALSSINIDGGSITGITDLAVADGGTGASDAATARTNLGLAIGSNVAAAGANSDITSLSGLSTALSVGQGGTGLTALGAAGQVLKVNSGATALEYAAASSGKMLQFARAETSALATGTGTIPQDDTIPQNTEGNEWLTLAFTPVASDSTLLIESISYMFSNASGSPTAAIFVDSTASALGAAQVADSAANVLHAVPLAVTVSAASTSSRTYKLRGGGHLAGTTTLNGAAGTRRYGGTFHTFLQVTEIGA